MQNYFSSFSMENKLIFVKFPYGSYKILADHWSCIWNSGKFSVAKAYKHLSGHNTVHPGFKWIWNSSCQNKHKVFCWLILTEIALGNY